MTPLNVKMPAPALVNPPAPLPMMPLIVVSPAPVTVSRLAPLVTSPATVSVPASDWRVPAPTSVIARLATKVRPAVDSNVPVLKLIVFVADASPKPLAAPIFTTPPLMAFAPLYVFTPDNVTVPTVVLFKPTAPASIALAVPACMS